MGCSNRRGEGTGKGSNTATCGKERGTGAKAKKTVAGGRSGGDDAKQLALLIKKETSAAMAKILEVVKTVKSTEPAAKSKNKHM